jgi:hypothetical protein
MHYDFTTIPDADVPQAVEPFFQRVLTNSARPSAPRSVRFCNLKTETR